MSKILSSADTTWHVTEVCSFRFLKQTQKYYSVPLRDIMERLKGVQMNMFRGTCMDLGSCVFRATKCNREARIDRKTRANSRRPQLARKTRKNNACFARYNYITCASCFFSCEFSVIILAAFLSVLESDSGLLLRRVVLASVPPSGDHSFVTFKMYK